MAKRTRSNSFLQSPITDSSEESHLPSSPPTKIAVLPTTNSPRVRNEGGGGGGGGGGGHTISQLIQCSLPPHKDTLTFSSYDAYESHYIKTHVNRCSECGKNFPTLHILNIHIEENHDPLILARRDRGEKTFSCFVEGCERKCSTAQKRRRHLIDKHMFPRNYNFFIVNDGIDKHDSLLRPSTTKNHGYHRRLSIPLAQEGRLRNRHTSLSSTAPPTAEVYQETKEEDHDKNGLVGDVNVDVDVDEVDALTSSLAALRFVPTSVIMRSRHEKK